jgi:dUTP pyrophosphatase
MTLLVYVGTDDTYKPRCATQHSAGIDVISEEEDTCLQPGQRQLFKTGLYVKRDRAQHIALCCGGFYFRVAPKSGLALKQGLDVLAGVIDIDYPAEIGVILINTNRTERVWIRKHQQIAQLVLERCFMPHLFFAVVNEDRVGGFGSTSQTVEQPKGASCFGSTSKEPS